MHDSPYLSTVIICCFWAHYRLSTASSSHVELISYNLHHFLLKCLFKEPGLCIIIMSPVHHAPVDEANSPNCNQAVPSLQHGPIALQTTCLLLWGWLLVACPLHQHLWGPLSTFSSLCMMTDRHVYSQLSTARSLLSLHAPQVSQHSYRSNAVIVAA